MATIEKNVTPQAHELRTAFGRNYTGQMTQVRQPNTPNPEHRHIWIVAGTSCCGKSTVAAKLAEQLGCEKFIEGDDYHTAENRAKMAKGIALTDEDRAPWLDLLRGLAVSTLKQASSSDPRSKNIVVTCSALKQSYRQVFRRATKQDARLRVHFIFLTAPVDVLVARIKSRKGHFFSGEAMVRSQMETLEMPTATEVARDVIHVDCTADAESVEAEIFSRVSVVLQGDTSI